MLAGRCQQEVTDMLYRMHLNITFVLLSELILALAFTVSSNQCRSRSACTCRGQHCFVMQHQCSQRFDLASQK